MNTSVAKEVQTTPIVTGTDIFSLGPADVAPGPGEESKEDATPALETEEHPGEAKDSEEESSPDQKPDSQAKKGEAAQSTPRFKSHEEAERGYREIQGRATRAEQEASEAKRKLAELEAQQNRQREQQVEAAQQEEIDRAIDDYTLERHEKALADIEALDPDDPEHRKKVARIYAQFHSEVRKFTANPVGKDGKKIGGSVKAKGVETTEASIPQPSSEVTPIPPGVQTSKTEDRDDTSIPSATSPPREKIREYIDNRAREAKIDPEDELWVGVSLTTPMKDADGKSLSLDQQIDWTINRYNERMAAIKAPARQAAGLPLGEGGRVPRNTGSENETASPGSFGLGDAIARANERRRLV